MSTIDRLEDKPSLEERFLKFAEEAIAKQDGEVVGKTIDPARLYYSVLTSEPGLGLTPFVATIRGYFTPEPGNGFATLSQAEITDKVAIIHRYGGKFSSTDPEDKIWVIVNRENMEDRGKAQGHHLAFIAFGRSLNVNYDLQDQFQSLAFTTIDHAKKSTRHITVDASEARFLPNTLGKSASDGTYRYRVHNDDDFRSLIVTRVRILDKNDSHQDVLLDHLRAPKEIDGARFVERILPSDLYENPFLATPHDDLTTWLGVDFVGVMGITWERYEETDINKVDWKLTNSDQEVNPL